MGEKSSDEIVLTGRQDNSSDSSDIVVATSRPAKKTRKSRRRSSGDGDVKRPKSGLCRVRVAESGSEHILHLERTDTLEEAHQRFCRGDSSIKMKYRSTVVSRYLTLEEIGFVEDDVIFICGPHRESPAFRIRVNVDPCRTVEIAVDPNASAETILEALAEDGMHGDLLLRNGFVIDPAGTIRDVVCAGDVVDLVDRCVP